MMVFIFFTLDYKIINVTLNLLIKEVVKDSSHESLVCPTRIFKVERHDLLVIHTHMSVECNVVFIFSHHFDLVKTI